MGEPRNRRRKRFYDMTPEELQAYEASDQYRVGRTDAFDHGSNETIFEYWDRDAPNYEELLTIVRNLLKRTA